MSYEIQLRGRTNQLVSNERGEALKALLESQKPPTYVDINGNMYRLSEVTGLEHVADPRPPADYDRQISGPPARPGGPGSGCTSTRSIQNEINQIIKDQHPQTWAKKIRDSKVRESIRKTLRENDPNWCDYKAGTCMCNTSQLTMAT